MNVTIEIPIDTLIDLQGYLLGKESAIVAREEDAYELYDVFRAFVGREPRPFTVDRRLEGARVQQQEGGQ